MKRAKKPVFFIVALLILFFTYASIFGIKGKNGDNAVTYIKGANDIRWGIDINGGVEATFSPVTNQKPTNAQIDSAESIIKQRLIGQNITDYEVYKDYNHSRIIVRFPWKNGETNFDPQKSIEELSATAQVTFREDRQAASQTTGSDGKTVYKTPKGVTASNVILQGSDIISAKPEMTQNKTTGQSTYVVSLKLSPAGTTKFAAATERLNGKIISIWMDDQMISWPVVNNVITNGQCEIDGGSQGFTAGDASELANKINAGALPFKLSATNSNTISPTLGKTSLQAMETAGIIAFILVAVFMLLVFRLPGFVAIISLLGQIALSLAAVSGFFPFMNSFTMTLPGIAGIILSIGMGVDANIITATRIKEELWTGKTLDSAITQGDDNSFSAIFDGNITVIIVAIILMLVFGPQNILSFWFGASTTGSIYSFGFTLLMGIIGNFLFGVVTTRLMTRSLSGFSFARSKWLYGGPKEPRKALSGDISAAAETSSRKPKAFHIRFYENRKIYFAISIGIMLIGLIFNIIFGTQLNVQFKGGAMAVYSYSGSIEAANVEKAVESAVKRNVDVAINTNVKSTGSDQTMNNVTLTFAGDQALSVADQKTVLTTLNGTYPNAKFALVNSNSVDPTMGKSFFAKSIVAVIITFLLLDVYIALRFRKIGGSAAGLFAIIALLHDVAMVYFTFIFAGIALDDNFIAVVLTILGYSLNDTIVIYDRIRENRRLMGLKAGYASLVDTSINQTLTRSLFTAGCTFSSIATVFVVGAVFNLASVTSFALPMMVGIVTGCYSSICIAGPLYVMWEKHKVKVLAATNERAALESASSKVSVAKPKMESSDGPTSVLTEHASAKPAGSPAKTAAPARKKPKPKKRKR